MSRSREFTITCSLCGTTIGGGRQRFIQHIEGPLHQLPIQQYLTIYPDTPIGPEDMRNETGDHDVGSEPSSDRTVLAIERARATEDREIEAWITGQKTRFRTTFGYPDGPILDATLGLMKINKRLEETYRRSERAGRPNLDILKAIRDNSKQIVGNIETMDASKNAMTSNDIAALHSQTMKEAEDYIRDHIGEFSWGCPSCSTVIMAGGLPHWALVKDLENNFVPWNPEIIKLVDEGRIRLHEAAYILRTSIEGLMIVAEERRHRFARRISKIDEERLLREKMLQEEA